MSGRAACAAAVALVLAGCAAPRPAEKEIVFFPPVPELPRIQYLTSFSGAKGFEEESSFRRFIVGAEAPRQLDKPYGVAIAAGRIYVCDTNQTVYVFDLKRRTFEPLAGAEGQGKLIQPINISIAEDGTKYVTDTVRGQVVVFGSDDAYLRAFGRPEEWKPVDAVPVGDRLYVADIAHAKVHILDRKSGERLGTLGDEGEPSARLNRPTNLAIDREGTLYVSDAGRFQVVKYDRKGAYVGSVGKVGNNLGHFARPKGISLDRDGRLYAVDASFNNVQVFSREGRLLLFFGKGGPGAGEFLLPAEVVVDYDHVPLFQEYVQPYFEVEYLILVTSQLGERLVSVFGFGKEKGKAYPSDEALFERIKERIRQQLPQEGQADAPGSESPLEGVSPKLPEGGAEPAGVPPAR